MSENPPPNSLQVLVDKAGNIRAAMRLPVSTARSGDAPTESGIAIPGQEVFQVDLPDALVKAVRPMLDDYIVKVDGKGKARLEKKK
ncbi:MAG: hypothetical protein E5Y79_28355 [Mesorhizobium sp.]|uniref:hypothetical protein n=1 Tax=Mesorhizobium sp. TaxID=1871066 RepID=UPI0012096D4C|nr:hypothetical protein [Mesorhizobium sp.]TIL56720.1 MAG: hypothetical protein E5Y79_28355 [Mesorhizobium sp.]